MTRARWRRCRRLRSWLRGGSCGTSACFCHCGACRVDKRFVKLRDDFCFRSLLHRTRKRDFILLYPKRPLDATILGVYATHRWKQAAVSVDLESLDLIPPEIAVGEHISHVYRG